MGQHKYNPTMAYRVFQEAMHNRGLLTPFDMNALLGIDNVYLK